MPVYTYFCEKNGIAVDVEHSMSETLKTWGEVCARAKRDPGDTPPKSAVKRLLHAPRINVPAGDSKLKEKGFTKLVRRDSGVYENVTATGGESRYFKADDPASMPHLHKKIGS